MNYWRSCLFMSLIVTFFATHIHGQDASIVPPVIAPKKSIENLATDLVTETHTITLNNRKCNYDSITGTLPIKNSDAKCMANIFFTAYFLKDSLQKNRPITFCFNGGPGSSSIWLHMGLLGPKRVVTNDLGVNMPPGSYQDNPYTFLEESDLVFVDPVSTGFSTPCEGVDPKQFYGFEGDISSIAEFIRMFTTQYSLWGSPKFLIGESYGTLRVVGLAEKLYDEYFLNVNGIVLISSCLNLQAAEIDTDNDLGFILALPSFAATSWYHHKLNQELQAKNLQEFLAEVEEFSMHEYATALLIGDRLDPNQKMKIATQVADYTGLSLDYILRANLRIRDYRFFKELLRDSSKVIGRFDSRYTGLEIDGVGENASYDPSMDAIAGTFTSAFQRYLQNDLAWKTNEPYRVLNDAVQPWNWGLKNQPAGMGYLSVSDHLRRSIIKNPSLHVFIASGYYDLATPYFATDYTIDHLGLPLHLRQHVSQHYYDAGHMMYLHEASLQQLKKDLHSFVQDSLKTN